MKRWAMQQILVYHLILIVISAEVYHPDRVINFPGAPSSPSFPLYSGYIKVDIEDARHNIFYVLCEAIHSDPLQSPLVVWLNGGPGASSFIGFLMENGPYKLREDGSLQYNDFSLNQYTNVLYIESPSSVGFSYSNILIERYNDKIIANLNVKVLNEFMTRVHPRYGNRDLFLAGESYAGSYIPYLAVAIYDGLSNGTFTNDRFRGLAIGNACIDIYSKRLSVAVQMHGTGFVPLKYSAKLRQQWLQWQEGLTNFDGSLHRAYGLDKELIDTYDSWLFKPVFDTRSSYNLHAVFEEDESEEIWHISRPRKDLEWTMVNITAGFMNRPDVQMALHAINSENLTRHWEAFNRPLFKNFSYYPYDTDNFRLLFYSGDLDLVCSALHVSHGTNIIAHRNRFEKVNAGPKIWSYLGDFAGAQSSYKLRNSNVTMDVLTVRGAGHFVLVNQPSRAFQIFNNFLFSNGTTIDYSKKIRRRKHIDF